MGDGSPIEFRCLECGKPLTYGGRGRKPKYCDEHKPSRAKGTGTRRSSLDKQLAQLADDFADNIRLVGMLVTPLLPVTGHVIATDADKTAQATIQLAKNNPKILLALQKASQIGPGVAFGRALLTIGVAVAVDTQRLAPDNQAAMMLGVTAVWQTIHGENTANAPSVPPPPAAFI